jgi:hypothetical protein
MTFLKSLELVNYTWLFLSSVNIMFTEPSKSPWISISINLFFSKLNLLVIKESLIKG